MPTVHDIDSFLCELAPLALQMDFDNAGFLIGHSDAQVERVLLALDITDEVVQEAIACKAQLIVSHHPVIFHGIRSIRDDPAGKKILALTENKIAAICMHTNLDIADGGVNDVLMHLLGGSVEGALDQNGCGRIGHLAESMSMEAFLAVCKEKLSAKGLRYSSSGRPVYKLAVMGGAGADAMEDAWAAGCDTYVTADVKYHEFLHAIELGLNLIDADHFCTENPVIPVLAERLSQRFPDTDFRISQSHHQLISFF